MENSSDNKQYYSLLKSMEKVSMIESYKSYDENTLNNKVNGIISIIQEIKQTRIDNNLLVKKFKDNYTTKAFKKKREKLLNDIASLSSKHMSQVIDLHNTMTIMFQFVVVSNELPREINDEITNKDLSGILKLSFLEAAFKVNSFEESGDLLKTFNFYRNFFAHNDGKIIFRKTKIQKIDEILNLFENIKKFNTLFEINYINELRFAKNVFTLIDEADIVKGEDDFYVQLTINDGEKQVHSINNDLLGDAYIDVFSSMSNGKLSKSEIKERVRILQNEVSNKIITPGEFLNKLLMTINPEKITNFMQENNYESKHFFNQMAEQLSQMKVSKMK